MVSPFGTLCTQGLGRSNMQMAFPVRLGRLQYSCRGAWILRGTTHIRDGGDSWLPARLPDVSSPCGAGMDPGAKEDGKMSRYVNVAMLQIASNAVDHTAEGSALRIGSRVTVERSGGGILIRPVDGPQPAGNAAARAGDGGRWPSSNK